MPTSKTETGRTQGYDSSFIRERRGEWKKIHEVIKGRNVTVVPVDNAGFIVHNNQRRLVAENPWKLFDLDDTAVKTSESKARCTAVLEAVGLPQETIAYCDKLARVDFHGQGILYHPEIDKRLISLALRMFYAEDLSGEEIKNKLEKAREVMVAGAWEDFRVDKAVEKAYRATRYAPGLYPGVLPALRSVRGKGYQGSNLAIFTRGFYDFQLYKTLPLLNEINEVWLTEVPKGEFIRQVIRQGTHRNLPLSYVYDSTPRNIGIDFKNDQIMVILFDDSPEEVESFNQVADEEGMNHLIGVVRVKRPNIKHGDRKVAEDKNINEVWLPGNYYDCGLWAQAVAETTARMLEDYVLLNINEQGIRVM
jgi:hypothetical protein